MLYKALLCSPLHNASAILVCKCPLYILSCSARSVCVLPRHDICHASRNNRRQRDELGFDYFFESHDGIQAPPFIYFEDGKPVSNLIKN